ncbi:hypothetical protein NPIL_662711 [Nephila pilipes]|uniref:Uncharacterized protein n=1 Tax=Nephila pilipes TaxID=299642 RepID=A0A8X6IZ19_NEPPI|nr:hypothetical protein NPIL_662711 [Nephila pilipes]
MPLKEERLAELQKCLQKYKTRTYYTSEASQIIYLSGCLGSIWRQSVVVPIFRRSRPSTRCRDTETNSAALTAMFAAPLDSDYASEEAAPRSQLPVAKMVAKAKDNSSLDGGMGMLWTCSLSLLLYSGFFCLRFYFEDSWC